MPVLLLPGLKTPPRPPPQLCSGIPGGHRRWRGGHTADVFRTSRFLYAHRPLCLLQPCLPAKHKALPHGTPNSVFPGTHPGVHGGFWGSLGTVPSLKASTRMGELTPDPPWEDWRGAGAVHVVHVLYTVINAHLFF